MLEVGNENCRCRFAQELPEAKTGIELAPRIRLPLVAGLLRQCTESCEPTCTYRCVVVSASCSNRASV